MAGAKKQRRAGSGLYGSVTSAVERLAAAVFARRPTAEHIANLDTALSGKTTALTGAAVGSTLRTIAERAELDVAEAESPDPDRISDIRLTMADGTHAWIEVKAQTTQGRNQLGAADWTHNETDTLRWLYSHEPSFRQRMPGWMAERLHVDDPDKYFRGWDFSTLWAADIARIRNPKKRAAAGVTDVASLKDFLTRMHLLHVTKGGARLIPMARVPIVDAALSGTAMPYSIDSERKSSASVTVRRAGDPDADPAFVYYVGYASGVVGRHKLYGWVLDQTPGTVEARHDGS